MPVKAKRDFLKKNFDKIGTAPTEMARWNESITDQESLKVQKYIARMAVASHMTAEENAIHNSRNKVRDEHNNLKKNEYRIIDRAFKGVYQLLTFTLAPIFDAFADIFYYRRRLGYTALRLLGSMLILAALLVPIIVIPALSAPIFGPVMVALGGLLAIPVLTATMIFVGLVSFRLIYGGVGKILDKLYTKENYHLSTPQVRAWSRKAGLDEDLLKMMKQYLINAEKKSEHPDIKFLIRSLRLGELTVPSESSVQKLAIFFIKQLKALRKEKLHDPNNKGVDLDIEAVTLILSRLAHCPLLPGGLKGTGGTRARIQALLLFPSVDPLQEPNRVMDKPAKAPVLERRHSTGSILEKGEPEKHRPILKIKPKSQ